MIYKRSLGIIVLLATIGCSDQSSDSTRPSDTTTPREDNAAEQSDLQEVDDDWFDEVQGKVFTSDMPISLLLFAADSQEFLPVATTNLVLKDGVLELSNSHGSVTFEIEINRDGLLSPADHRIHTPWGFYDVSNETIYWQGVRYRSN